MGGWDGRDVFEISLRMVRLLERAHSKVWRFLRGTRTELIMFWAMNSAHVISMPYRVWQYWYSEARGDCLAVTDPVCSGRGSMTSLNSGTSGFSSLSSHTHRVPSTAASSAVSR